MAKITFNPMDDERTTQRLLDNWEANYEVTENYKR